MPIEILSDNPENEMLNAAFDLIERKIKEGYRFDNRQKDLGIQLSIDALAPAERPWFLEICNMHSIPMWQNLWGQFRRCQEWGTAQIPLLDPGWEKDRIYEYGLEERICSVCGEVFKPKQVGQLYDKNVCGADAERKARPKVAQVALAQSLTSGENIFVEQLIREDSDSVDLGTDEVIEE